MFCRENDEDHNDKIGVQSMHPGVDDVHAKTVQSCSDAAE